MCIISAFSISIKGEVLKNGESSCSNIKYEFILFISFQNSLLNLQNNIENIYHKNENYKNKDAFYIESVKTKQELSICTHN